MMITSEMFKAGYCGNSIEKSPRIGLSRSGSSLNTTQDESANCESPCQFKRSFTLSATKALECCSSEEEEEIIDDQEDLDVSLASIGLDFV